MTEPGTIEFRDVPEPRPEPGEVLLRVQRIGVCGSDIHVNHGLHPFTPYPVVQGHEFSAVVEEVGADVQGIEPGTKATARPQIVCGECAPCRRGDYHICDTLRVRGFQAPGCAQDLFLTSADLLVPLPDSFTFEQGAMIEPLAVGVHSTARAGDLEGRNVAVLGAGPIGNLVAQVARCRGAARVLITDLSDYRLDVARRCGIEHTSNAAQEQLADAARRVFGDEGFSIAFEAAGVEASMDEAIANISKGGTIVVVAVFGEKPRIDMSIVGDRELSLVGTLMYKHEDYQRAVQLVSEQRVVLEPLVTKHFPFEDYARAYEFIDREGERSLKIMIDLV